MGQWGMRILNRLSPIWPGVPSFAWLVLGWTMLAHASTAQFTYTLAGSISTWLDKNAWAGFMGGLGLLALAVFWPELKPKLAWMRLPRTPGERLAIIESEHVPRWTQGN